MQLLASALQSLIRVSCRLPCALNSCQTPLPPVLSLPASSSPVLGPRIQGQFKGATTDIDRRHGDPDMAGLSSGEKVRLMADRLQAHACSGKLPDRDSGCRLQCCDSLYACCDSHPAYHAPADWCGHPAPPPALLNTDLLIPGPLAPIALPQATLTRSERYGDEVHFLKDAPPEKQEAAERFK